MVDGLVRGLVDNGVEVEMFGVAQRSLHGVKVHSLYKTEQYPHTYRPLFESMPILLAHIENVLRLIREDGGFDVIHDRNGQLGPMHYSGQRRLRERHLSFMRFMGHNSRLQ